MRSVKVKMISGAAMDDIVTEYNAIKESLILRIRLQIEFDSQNLLYRFKRV
jgi:hypothetical protein